MRLRSHLELCARLGPRSALQKNCLNECGSSDKHSRCSCTGPRFAAPSTHSGGEDLPDWREFCAAGAANRAGRARFTSTVVHPRSARRTREGLPPRKIKSSLVSKYPQRRAALDQEARGYVGDSARKLRALRPWRGRGAQPHRDLPDADMAARRAPVLPARKRRRGLHTAHTLAQGVEKQPEEPPTAQLPRVRTPTASKEAVHASFQNMHRSRKGNTSSHGLHQSVTSETEIAELFAALFYPHYLPSVERARVSAWIAFQWCR